MSLIISPTRLQRVLASVPGPIHHPWSTYRALLYGLCDQKGIPESFIELDPWLHLLIHYIFGNGSPRENLGWIIRGQIDLSSILCQMLFGGVLTPQKAAEIFETEYSTVVDRSIVRAFAANPYSFERRWHGGVSFVPKPEHIIAVWNLMPDTARRKIPPKLRREYQLAA